MFDIVVSFTSYPKRILTVHKVLDSIVKQTILPNKIVLYLSLHEFENFGAMPDLKRYEKYGFEIHWCDENLRSHKKYYYAMQQYPDDIVITIDDDFYYKKTMIEELLKYHKKYPKAVIARRAHLVTWEQDGSIAPYEKWYSENFAYIGTPRMDLVATGCSGILYPPHIFQPEVFNKDLFMDKAPYADDLWLKVMELYSDIPVVLAKQFFDDPGLEDYSENGLYCNKNEGGGNDRQLHALLAAYSGSGQEDFLINRLSSQGKLMFSDLEKVRKNDIYRVMDEYLQMIDDQETVVIYGAGNIARKLYNAFMETGRIKKIGAFVVKYVGENEKELGGIKVKNYMDFINTAEKIVIGVSELMQEEIYNDLIVKGVKEERVIRLSPFVSRIIKDL